MTMLQARSPRAVFFINQHGDGRWSARRGDGLVGGIFVDHDAALRFVERESLGAAAVIVEDARQSRGVGALTDRIMSSRAPRPSISGLS